MKKPKVTLSRYPSVRIRNIIFNEELDFEQEAVALARLIMSDIPSGTYNIVVDTIGLYMSQGDIRTAFRKGLTDLAARANVRLLEEIKE